MDGIENGPEEELLSLEEAADFLYVSKSTLYRLLTQGKLQGMKAGKQWRFRKADLLAYMQRGPAAMALANLPMQVLDEQLASFADALLEAGASPADCDDPALAGEAGKLSQLVRRMIWLLHTYGGSDIHLEPIWEAGREYLRVRLRVEGELRDFGHLPFCFAEPLAVEWKQRAGLAIEARTRPQEGSARIAFGETLVPLRVSIVPTLYGERVAVRTIPTRVPTLDEIGLGGSPLKEWVRQPRGLLLITSPTGGGKATTRAACLRELNACDLNIMAVEERVEYVFEAGVAQLKVEGFTCAEGVRAILRQDPDVIVVGELRGDPEFAQAAALAAETGHLVLACLHAYDSISPLYDFLEWGVKRSLLAENLVGIVNQHLVRKLCEVCKVGSAPDADLLAEVRKAAEEGGYHVPEGATFYIASGCEACRGEGHTGRFALHEYFTFTPDLREAFLHGAPREELARLSRGQRHPSSFAAGVRKAVEGVTSLEEVMRRIPNWRS